MKKQLFCILCFSCALSAGAQIRGALVVGPQGASVTPAFTPFPDTVATTSPQKGGVHIGFLADIPLARRWYLQAGLQYSAKGSKVQQVFDPATSELQTALTTLSVNYIDAPFHLVYKQPLKGKTRFIIGAGPQASLFYNGHLTQNTLDVMGKYDENKEEDLPVGNGEGKYKVLHFAAHAFGGLEFGRTFLTVNYSQGLNSFHKNETQAFQHKTIGATLGIFLGKQPTTTTVPVVKDRDGDRVPDDLDACADVAGNALTKGCPDKDGDGVADQDDQCPDVAGLLKYHGCPVPDTDKDGVNDEEDQCPTVFGTARYKGCPVPDTDGDGINDEADKCPNQAGTKANNGCPEISQHVAEKVGFAARQIQFDFQKATLTTASHEVLNEVATILKAHPDQQLSVEGHTTGGSTNDAANLKLSQSRAEAVKTYLVSKGIAAERITATGYGSSRPVYTGNDPLEKAKNRRVELKLSQL